VALSEEFSADPSKRLQWGAFVKRGRLKISEPELARVIEALRAFLGPAVEAAGRGDDLNTDPMAR
jgi:hypothetical protein